MQELLQVLLEPLKPFPCPPRIFTKFHLILILPKFYCDTNIDVLYTNVSSNLYNYLIILNSHI